MVGERDILRHGARRCGYWGVLRPSLVNTEGDFAVVVSDMATIGLRVRGGVFRRSTRSKHDYDDSCSALRRITIGYHRLYSHKAFRAALPVRVVLAALGSAGFQGSIKVCRLK